MWIDLQCSLRNDVIVAICNARWRACPKKDHGSTNNVTWPQEATPTKPQRLMATKKAATWRIDVVHPKKGLQQCKQWGCKETTMSCGRKNHNDKGTMLHAPKKASATQNNVMQPQKAAKKGCSNESPMSCGRKKMRQWKVDVVCPKKGPWQSKTMSHGPKGHANKTPTLRGLFPRWQSWNEMGSKKCHSNAKQCRRSNESLTRAASKRPRWQSRNAAGSKKGCGNDDNLVVDMQEGWLLFFSSGKFQNFSLSLKQN